MSSYSALLKPPTSTLVPYRRIPRVSRSAEREAVCWCRGREICAGTTSTDRGRIRWGLTERRGRRTSMYVMPTRLSQYQRMPASAAAAGGRKSSGKAHTARIWKGPSSNAHGAWALSKQDARFRGRGPARRYYVHVPHKTADFGNMESAESATCRRILARQCELHGARVAAQW